MQARSVMNFHKKLLSLLNPYLTTAAPKEVGGCKEENCFHIYEFQNVSDLEACKLPASTVISVSHQLVSDGLFVCLKPLINIQICTKSKLVPNKLANSNRTIEHTQWKLIIKFAQIVFRFNNFLQGLIAGHCTKKLRGAFQMYLIALMQLHYY